MGVKLGIARGQTLEETGEEGLVDVAILKEAKDVIGVVDLPLAKRVPGTPAQPGEQAGMREAVGITSPSQAEVQAEGVVGEAELADPELGGIGHEDVEDGGMEVEVEVAVDVVQFETGGVKLVELGVDFGAELVVEMAAEKVAPARPRGVGLELLAVPGEAGNSGRGQEGASAGQGEVEADAEGGVGAGQSDSFGSAGFGDHEAGGGEDAVLMGADDGLIDGGGAAEIIGIDDEAARGLGVWGWGSQGVP